MGRRESGGIYLRARDLTSAKKASYTFILSCRAGGGVQKTEIFFQVQRSYQCKRYTFFLSCKRVLPVQKTSQNLVIHFFPVVQEGLTSAKKLEIFFKVQGSYQCKKLAQKKVDTHFSCRARGSVQKKLARNILCKGLTSAKPYIVQKKLDTHLSCRAKGVKKTSQKYSVQGSYTPGQKAKKVSYNQKYFVQGSYHCKKLAVQ